MLLHETSDSSRQLISGIFLQQTVWSDGGRSREAVHFNRQNRISTILNFIRYTHMCLRRWMPVGFLHIPTFKHSLVVIVYHPFNVQFEMNWFEMRKLLALVKTWFQSKHCEQMKWTNFQLNGANTEIANDSAKIMNFSHLNGNLKF